MADQLVIGQAHTLHQCLILLKIANWPVAGVSEHVLRKEVTDHPIAILRIVELRVNSRVVGKTRQ